MMREDRFESLRAMVRASAAETEERGVLSEELMGALRDAGALRMIAPAAYGGDQCPLPDTLEVVMSLASADPSVGWVVGQAATAQLVLSYFPTETMEDIYRSGPDVIGAGAVAPKGKALRQADGWRVSGRWPFVSGSVHASWFYGQCLAYGGSGESTGEVPELVTVMVPMAECRLVPTWQSLGLRGTSSHDIEVRSSRVPMERSCSFIAGSSTLADPAYAIPTVDFSALVVAASAAGIASGAVDTLRSVVSDGRRPSFSQHRLIESPIFQDRLGQAYLHAWTARDVVRAEARAVWTQVEQGARRGPVERARTRATANHVMHLATTAVDLAYTMVGGSSAYDASPLQRWMRDIHTATQHGVAAREASKILGASLVDIIDPSLEW